MSEQIICPICETANPADASHCEVCGERLTPAAEGEVLSPEENVAASLQADDEEEEDAFSDGGSMAMSFEVPIEGAADDENDFAEVPIEADADDVDFDLSSDDEELYEASALAVLYSPLDGTAYPEGTPEYEEGFGPMGEELVAEPPALADAEGSEAGQDFGGEDDGFDDGSDEDNGFESNAFEAPGFDQDDDFDASPAEDDMAEESVVDAPAEPVRPVIVPLRQTARQEEHLAPLPTPSVFAEPATLTIYQNRQPVHTVAIDGDEMLIGRRDPVANAFPEIDLSEYDNEGSVSRKHAYIFRQNKHYTLYVTSNTGTQINQDLLSLGDRRELSDGDVIILAGKLAMKFQIPALM